jgi:hypothetical protein
MYLCQHAIIDTLLACVSVNASDQFSLSLSLSLTHTHTKQAILQLWTINLRALSKTSHRKTKDSGPNGSRHYLTLSSSCMKFWFVSVVLKYLKCCTFLKDLFAIFILWFCPGCKQIMCKECKSSGMLCCVYSSNWHFREAHYLRNVGNHVPVLTLLMSQSSHSHGHEWRVNWTAFHCWQDTWHTATYNADCTCSNQPQKRNKCLHAATVFA